MGGRPGGDHSEFGAGKSPRLEARGEEVAKNEDDTRRDQRDGVDRAGAVHRSVKLVRSSVLSRCHSRILSGPQTPSWRSSSCLFSQSALSLTDHCPSTRSYLYHQFDGFSWRDLRFRKRPLRIGEVLILPVTGFSPVGDRDVDAEGVDSPQACVVSFESLWRRA